MKRIKKLMALVLALAMVMSLAMTAHATGNDYTGDSQTGSVQSEGGDPLDEVNVIVPTASTLSNYFNIWLDPNDLIKETNAERYQDAQFGKYSAQVTKANFTSTDHLYFRSIEKDGQYAIAKDADDNQYDVYTYVPADVSNDLEADAVYYSATNSKWYDKDGDELTAASKVNTNVSVGYLVGQTVPTDATEKANKLLEWNLVSSNGTVPTTVSTKANDATGFTIVVPDDSKDVAFVLDAGSTDTGKWYEVDLTGDTAKVTTTTPVAALGTKLDWNATTGGATYDKYACTSMGKKTIDKYVYSDTSNGAKIYNKSNIAVGMTMTAKLLKGAGNDFAFVDSRDKLAEAKGPAMYLALVANKGTVAVTQADDAVPTVKISGDTKKAIESITFTWAEDVADDAKEAFAKVLEDTNAPVWTVSWSGSTEVTASVDGTVIGKVDSEITDAQRTANDGKVVQTIDNSGEEITFTLLKDSTDDESDDLEIGSLAIAYVEPDEDAPANRTPANGDSATFTLEPVKGVATISAAVSDTDDAYKTHANNTTWATVYATKGGLGWKSTETKSDGQPDNLGKIIYTVTNSDATTKLVVPNYLRILDEKGEMKNDDFQFESFKLVGAINNHEDWADVDADKMEVEVIWDAHAYDKTIDGDLPDNVAPSVKVVATAANENDTVELSFDLGSGKQQAASVTKVQYGSSSNITLTENKDGVLKFVASKKILAVDEIKVTFTKSNGKTMVATLNYKTVGNEASAE